MPLPIDYSSGLDEPDMMGEFARGMQLRDAVDARMSARQRAADYARDVQRTMANPRASSFAQLTLKYPEESKSLKQAWDMMAKEQQDSEFISGAQVYNAIATRNYSQAKSMLDEQIQATENAGQDASELKTLRQELDTRPNTVAGQIALHLSAVDPERWGKMATEMRAAARAPAELSEAQSKAEKAAIDAKYADALAVKDLEKKGWDIWKLQQDASIARENLRIAAMNADMSAEKNVLEREKLRLKIEEAERKRDEGLRTKTAEIENARANIDNMLNTADRILATPLNVMHNAMGPADEKLLTLRQSSADFEELVKNIDAQAFLAQVPLLKGMGALSDAEGNKLASALQNFSLRQSPEQMVTNLREAQRLLLKARKTLADKYGVPETIPDTPLAKPTPEEIDKILQQYGVASDGNPR